ncbi:MAG: protein kinase [Chloroflexales bacterium]|nr:protein kinase [Chloroflexales bacterium]
MQLTPGHLLQNRYQIVTLIAQSGMGAVYQATDQRLGNTVALKQTLVRDPQLSAAFEREARLLANLNHPVLPVVSDHFTESNEQFLVMQYIPGDDLGALLPYQGAFAQEQALEWGDSLLDALDYLHTQQPPIIHRDIKPQNLKLMPRGNIVLLDFGLAKGAVEPGPQPLVDPSIAGYTPQYAPLEQIQGAGTDARSDLYSLAATLYHILTGVAPPNTLARAAAAVSHQPDPLQPANELNPRVSPAVAAVLHQAMAQNPAQRFTSAAAMRTALRDARISHGATTAQPINSSGQSTLVIRPSAQATNIQPAFAAPAIAASSRQRGIVLSPKLIGAALITLILVFGASAGGLFFLFQQNFHASPSDTMTDAPSTSEGGSVLLATSADLADPELGFKRSNPFPAKSTVAVAGWEIQVLEMVRGREAWNRIHEANINNDPPPEGMEYVLLKLQVKSAHADRTPREIDKYTFRITGDRLIDYKWSPVVEPEPRLEAEISSGEAATGWAGYLVGAGEGNLMLIIHDVATDTDYQEHRYFIALDESAAIDVDPALRKIIPAQIGAQPSEPALFGQQVITEDWEVTVRDVVRGDAAWELIYATNQFNDPPAPGMEYIAVSVQVRYIGTVDDRELVDSNDFQTRDSAGRTYDSPSIIDPKPALEAYLFPGGVYEGWIVVQAPIDDTGTVLVFQPGFLDDDINIRYLALAE